MKKIGTAGRKVAMTEVSCHRCEHKWITRKERQLPRICPKCKSAYWDVPRRQAQRGSEDRSTSSPGR